MCGNKRRQRRAQEAALIAAAAKLDQHYAKQNSRSRGRYPQSSGLAQGLPTENPPPYTYAEKHLVEDRKEAGLSQESSYDDVAREWLSASSAEERRPSFGAYHSFDTAPHSEKAQPVAAPVSQSMYTQAAAPTAIGGLLGWLVQRQQNKRRGGCCGRRRAYC